jgi:Ca2+-binding RTX toxin-like protein
MRRTFSALVISTALLAAVAAPALSQEPEATCLGAPATNPGSLSGTRGDDVIIGTLGADHISSGGGDDMICGEPDGSTTGGGDRIDAGQGNDFVLGFYGDDSLDGGQGDDELFGGDFSGEFGNLGSKLNDGNDHIEGGQGGDTLAGMKGVDHLEGGQGVDFMAGGPDNDWLEGGQGGDFMAGMFGNDLLEGGQGDDFLNGDLQPEDDPVQDPNANSDDCRGGQGNDSLVFCELSS